MIFLPVDKSENCISSCVCVHETIFKLLIYQQIMFTRFVFSDCLCHINRYIEIIINWPINYNNINKNKNIRNINNNNPHIFWTCLLCSE